VTPFFTGLISLSSDIDFNLIVTHEPGLDNYRWVRSQLRQLLGNDLIIVDSYQSIILAKVSNPHEAARVLREKLKDSSTPIMRAIPVDYVTDPLIDKVEEIVKELAVKIPKGAKFRITLNGHLYEVREGFLRRLHTLDAIKRLAEYIDRPVDLKNPDYIVFIKVVRLFKHIEKVAISLLKKEELMRIGGGYS